MIVGQSFEISSGYGPDCGLDIGGLQGIMAYILAIEGHSWLFGPHLGHYALLMALFRAKRGPKEASLCLILA